MKDQSLVYGVKEIFSDRKIGETYTVSMPIGVRNGGASLLDALGVMIVFPF